MRLRVLVDPVAYTLSSFGGLITYWDGIIPLLVPQVDLRIAPASNFRAPLPADLRQPTPGWNPDVFVSTYYTMGPETVPSVAVVHDLIYEDKLASPAAMGDPVGVERKRRCILAARQYVVPSHTTEQALEEHYPTTRGRIRVAHHGVDSVIREFPGKRAFSAATVLLHENGVRDGFFLYIGGRSFYKDFATLAKAMLEVSGRHPQVRLIAVGSEIDPRSDELDLPGIQKVVMTGYVQRDVLGALYRLASAVVSTSSAEGFGLPILEAATAGTPVVCSDIPVHREVAPAGTRFFPVRDVRAAAALLCEVLCEEAGRPAHTCQDHHGWDTSALSLTAALAEAADIRLF